MNLRAGAADSNLERDTNRRTTATAMRISDGTIDCWLNVPGDSSYSDFQHHHWDIGPSVTIDTSANNTFPSTWSLNGGGYKVNNGHWTINNQSKTSNNGAKVLIANSSTVSLTNLIPGSTGMMPVHSPTTNTLHADGNSVTAHDVEELTWPDFLTWSSSASTPISYADAGAPTYQLTTTPVVVRGRGKVRHFLNAPPLFVGRVLLDLESFTLKLTDGVGGRDWDAQPATFFGKPAAYTAFAWWAWTINLI